MSKLNDVSCGIGKDYAYEAADDAKVVRIEIRSAETAEFFLEALKKRLTGVMIDPERRYQYEVIRDMCESVIELERTVKCFREITGGDADASTN